MVLDKLDNYITYLNLHPSFKRVFEYLRSTDLANLPVGRVSFKNETFYVNVDEVSLRPEEDAFLEAHDQYVDIQLPLRKSERMGYLPRSECKKVRMRNDDRDFVLYNDAPSSYFEVSPGDFVVFFPQDAHAPIIGEGMTKKIVVKVPVV